MMTTTTSLITDIRTVGVPVSDQDRLHHDARQPDSSGIARLSVRSAAHG